MLSKIFKNQGNGFRNSQHRMETFIVAMRPSPSDHCSKKAEKGEHQEQCDPAPETHIWPFSQTSLSFSRTVISIVYYGISRVQQLR